MKSSASQYSQSNDQYKTTCDLIEKLQETVPDIWNELPAYAQDYDKSALDLFFTDSYFDLSQQYQKYLKLKSQAPSITFGKFIAKLPIIENRKQNSFLNQIHNTVKKYSDTKLQAVQMMKPAELEEEQKIEELPTNQNKQDNSLEVINEKLNEMFGFKSTYYFDLPKNSQKNFLDPHIEVLQNQHNLIFHLTKYTFDKDDAIPPLFICAPFFAQQPLKQPAPNQIGGLFHQRPFHPITNPAPQPIINLNAQLPLQQEEADWLANPNAPRLSKDFIAKINTMYQSGQFQEYLQDEHKTFYIQVIKKPSSMAIGAKNQEVSRIKLTNIDDEQVIFLERQIKESICLMGINTEISAKNEKEIDQLLNVDQQDQILKAVEEFKSTQQMIHKRMKNYPEIFIYVKDSSQVFCLDYANIDQIKTHRIKITTGNVQKISLLQLLQTPEDLSQRYKCIEMLSGQPEYKLVYDLFTSTIECDQAKIIKVQRLYNKPIQERFKVELKLATSKYPNKTPNQLLKLLFHGTRTTPSENIYQSEEGLDMRYSRNGYYGQGIYFANNAKYSHQYAYPTNGNQTYEMFLVFVLVGQAVTLPNHDSNMRMPPCLPGSQVDRYDSVMNGAQDHVIVYNNQRQYPAFLITYTHPQPPSNR